jgi:DNA invertase Pin-like site-specific DNA recombinase
MNVMVMRPRGRPAVKEPDAIVKKLFAIHGMQSQIADACGIRSQAVSQWKRVPGHWVQIVSEVTGIPPEQIRPDIFKARR